MIGGLEGFEVKFHAGVNDPGFGMGVSLQFGVMRGDQTGDRMFHQVIDNGACQGRPFLRVGACAEFVEQHQLLCIHTLEDADDIGNVP